MLEAPEFRSQYSRLAKYLDLFGPCQKKQSQSEGGGEGWWSNYGDAPGGNYCAEVTKLIFAVTLGSQVHYCRELATGAAKPKVGPMPTHGPPYRLDEPPVTTQWLNTTNIYKMTDAAITHGFHKVLRKHAETAPDQAGYRSAILDAAAELEAKPVNRELAALSLLRMMLRNYEGVHLRHLQL